MPDWRDIVESRLGKVSDAPARREEIVAELSDYLEDCFEGNLCRGHSSSAARAIALREITDWRSLSRKLRCTFYWEGDMKQQLKPLWLPCIGTLILANVFLRLLTASGLQPHFVWLTERHAFLFYVPWLIGLPVIGALGAFTSRQFGGAVRQRIMAGVFPAAAMFGLFSLMLPLLPIADFHVPLTLKLAAMAMYFFNWVLFPGVMLLLGALPFLRSRPVSISQSPAKMVAPVI